MGSKLGDEGDFIPNENALAMLGGRLVVGVPARDGRERLTVPMSVSSSIVDLSCVDVVLNFRWTRPRQPTAGGDCKGRSELY